MHIYVYSDESGVLDKKHYRYYVYGGIVFLSFDDKEKWTRKYLSAEQNIRSSEGIQKSSEVKASTISNTSKNKLYRSLRNVEKFGIVINQSKLRDDLYNNKKTKQRYLDWAYKMSIKNKFVFLIKNGFIDPSSVSHISFFVDEHTTATNGRYELQEALENEFKIGTWNFEHQTFYSPLFPDVHSVTVDYCNSSTKTLVRAADIVSNHLFYLANCNNGIISSENRLTITYHP